MYFGLGHLPHKMNANRAIARTYCTAVASAERSAAFVSFRWQPASLPPVKNVNSAVAPVLAAVQFGGYIAQSAINAVTNVLFVIC